VTWRLGDRGSCKGTGQVPVSERDRSGNPVSERDRSGDHVEMRYWISKRRISVKIRGPGLSKYAAMLRNMHESGVFLPK
jgi:hypothetical protein